MSVKSQERARRYVEKVNAAQTDAVKQQIAHQRTVVLTDERRTRRFLDRAGRQVAMAALMPMVLGSLRLKK